MANPFGEEETRRQRKLRDQREREERARTITVVRRRIFCQTRGVFVCLLTAAVLVFAVSHFSKIDTVAVKKMDQTAARIHAQAEASPIRQGALNYEREVDAIATK